jgi:hypothetical protein
MCNRSDALSRPVLMVRGLDGFLVIFRCASARWRGQLCGFQGPGEGLVSQPFGGDSEGDTPLPIPNREVKPLSADGTWASRPWESRSPPVLTEKGRSNWGGPFRRSGRFFVQGGPSSFRAALLRSGRHLRSGQSVLGASLETPPTAPPPRRAMPASDRGRARFARASRPQRSKHARRARRGPRRSPYRARAWSSR